MSDVTEHEATRLFLNLIKLSECVERHCSKLKVTNRTAAFDEL